MIQHIMRLDLFDGDGGAGAAAPSAGDSAQGSAAGATTPAAGEKKHEKPEGTAVRYGRPTKQEQAAAQSAPKATEEAPQQETPADPEKEFRALIDGKFKNEFGRAVQGILGRRLPAAKNDAETVKKFAPLIERLAIKNGIERGANGRYDVDAVLAAEMQSEEYIDREAERRGLSRETTRSILQLEHEKAERLQQDAERREAEQRRAEDEKSYQKYLRHRAQAEELRKTYPSFDLISELANPEFRALLDSGVTVPVAYAALHHNEIVNGSIQFAADTARMQLANAIAAKGQRPVENGVAAGGAQGVVWKDDPRTFTPQDRENIRRIVARGGKVYL